MKLIKSAVAGTLESSDLYVQVEPREEGIEIEISSVVMAQFGDDIERVAREILEQQSITAGLVRIDDRGAIDCVIRARVETALLRGKMEGESDEA